MLKKMVIFKENETTYSQIGPFNFFGPGNPATISRFFKTERGVSNLVLQ